MSNFGEVAEAVAQVCDAIRKNRKIRLAVPNGFDFDEVATRRLRAATHPDDVFTALGISILGEVVKNPKQAPAAARLMVKIIDWRQKC